MRYVKNPTMQGFEISKAITQSDLSDFGPGFAEMGSASAWIIGHDWNTRIDCKGIAAKSTQPHPIKKAA
jgi:hypothetical protein